MPSSAETLETRVATAPSVRASDEWALVLAAEGLAPRVVRAGDGWGIWVEAADAERAAAALAAYLREQPAPGAATPRSEWRGDAPWVVALLLSTGNLLFHLETGDASAGSSWFERGAATASIVAGEPWRAITALSLHASPAHAMSNAVAGALFFTLWLRILGPGVGAALLLAAGALGNALNAWLQLPQHVSVGASTAVFGAVGLLVGVAALRRGGGGRGRHRPWVVAAAGLSLLAMLGTGGERTDLWAHAFGLAAGAALGVLAGALWRRPPPAWAQWTGGLLVVTGLVGAWQLALS